MNTHTLLIDLVNDAETQQQHDHHHAVLRGWRAGVEYCGRKWSGVEADNHTMQRFGEDRPMCCGVLLDWEPAEDKAQRARDKCIGAYGYDLSRLGA